MNFPVELYGLPKAESYSYNTDLVLLKTTQASGYTRQRRTHMHNASLFTLTFKVSTVQAAGLRDWLQLNNDWFSILLLSGNDASQACGLHPVDVRRTSTINSNRVPMLDQFIISFEAETRAMSGYQTLANAAAGLVVQEYPSTLPVPSMNGFSASHGLRNVTVYSLKYVMDTETLKRWQAFAGYIGTAWFRTFMVSPNAYGTDEVLRYTGSPSMTLIRPNIWEVTIEASTLPFLLANLTDTLLPPGDCTYDSNTTYDSPVERYDCGGVAPPIGNFVVPAGTFNVNVSATGYAPQVTSAMIVFRQNGAVESTPFGSPAWTQWHTNAASLPAAAIAFDVRVEISNNGTTWNTYVPSGDGPYVSLRDSDIFIRRKTTSNNSVNEVYPVNISLQSDRQTDQMSIQNVTVSFNTNIVITNNPSPIIQNFRIADVMRIEVNPDATVSPWRVGAIIRPDGSSSSVNSNVSDGDWALPHTVGLGAGKWIVATKTQGPDTVPNEGVRMSMAVNVTYDVLTLEDDYRVSWIGTLQIYDAQVGGTLLGSGTLSLDGYVSIREPDPPPGPPPEIPVNPV